MSKYNIESFYRALLPSGLPKAIVGSTLSVSKVPTLTSGMLTIDPNTPSEEIVEYNGINGTAKTITISKRGINPASTSLSVAGTDYNNPTFAFAHNPLALISGDINNIHINQGIDFSVPNTITTDTTFSSELIASWEFKWPVFVDTTARDAEYTSPTNGDECFIIGTGKQIYSGGAWTTLGVGSPTPNGSETVAGIWEGATLAQMATSTDIGETGAVLIPMNKNLKKTSAGAADENKIPLLDATGGINNFVQVATLGTTVNESWFTTASEFVTNVGGSARRITSTDLRDFYVDSATSATMASTNTESVNRTVANRFITPAQTKELISIVAGSTFSSASIGTTRNVSITYPWAPVWPNGGTTTPVVKQWTIYGSGTYTLAGNVTGGGSGYYKANLYKNGVFSSTIATGVPNAAFSTNIVALNWEVYDLRIETNATGTFNGTLSGCSFTYSISHPMWTSTSVVD